MIYDTTLEKSPTIYNVLRTRKGTPQSRHQLAPAPLPPTATYRQQEAMNKNNKTMLDASSLVLDEYYQSRQSALDTNNKTKAAAEILKEQQIKEIVVDLESGKGIHTPLKVHEIKGRLYVVSGFHRTLACQKYMRKHKGKQVLVPAYVTPNSTRADAFRDSLTQNAKHGVQLSKSERLHNQFKLQIMEGENVIIQSKRDTATAYGCGNTHGGHLSNALKACKAVGIPTVEEWSKSPQRAAKGLRQRLEAAYGMMPDSFDKDGFPKARKLAEAYTGIDPLKDLNDDDLEKLAIEHSHNEIEKLLAQDPEAFRKALKRFDREALGISFKREWTPDRAELLYRNGSDTLMF